MADSTLRYTARDLDELGVGECAIRRCKYPGGETSWRIWFRVVDEIGADAGTIALLSVGLNVGGAFSPGDGTPGARRWGFIRASFGTWQVSPSIDCADVWHHTPLVIEAPEPAPWE